MLVRALIVALIPLLSSSLRGESVAERKPWHSVIPPPRAGLPVVTIDLGYPGPYVPMLNAPIVIRATANDVPFDGYIGYHFAVGDRLTLDTPVIARATLRPHESWSFSTTASLRKWGTLNLSTPREIGVEWRNSTMQKVASRSAGVPPWTSWDGDLLPLRVVASGAEMSAAEVLGGKPYVERADALPDRAQWYTGFSAVVIPVATWLDLPEKIREAIFGSGRSVVFFGFPRPGQPIERLDQTLLPVTFSVQPGSYDAPWPYRDSRRMPVAAPLSWTAKDGADKIGPDRNPYIVRTNAAAWGADEVAVTRPLPAMARIGKRQPLSLNSLELEASDWPDETRRHFLSLVAKHDFLRVYSGTIAAIAAIVLAIVAWIVLRKTPRAVVAVSVVLAVTILFAERNRIRPPSDVRDYVIRAPIAPSIIDHFHVFRAYGPTPLAGPARTPRTSITGDYGKRADAEVRTSETPSSMGLLRHYYDWDAVSRWSYQRELDGTSTSVGNQAMATTASGDFHTPIGFWLVERPSGSSAWSRLGANLKTQSDGRAMCTFVLPSDVQSAEMSIPFNGDAAELTWSSGSTKLTLAKKNIYSNRSAEIPLGVLREIASHGGIVNVTFASPAERPYDKVWITIRESKS